MDVFRPDCFERVGKLSPTYPCFECWVCMEDSAHLVVYDQLSFLWPPTSHQRFEMLLQKIHHGIQAWSRSSQFILELAHMVHELFSFSPFRESLMVANRFCFVL